MDEMENQNNNQSREEKKEERKDKRRKEAQKRKTRLQQKRVDKLSRKLQLQQRQEKLAFMMYKKIDDYLDKTKNNKFGTNEVRIMIDAQKASNRKMINSVQESQTSARSIDKAGIKKMIKRITAFAKMVTTIINITKIMIQLSTIIIPRYIVTQIKGRVQLQIEKQILYGKYLESSAQAKVTSDRLDKIETKILDQLKKESKKDNSEEEPAINTGGNGVM